MRVANALQTRVINIKTDFAENITFSVQHSCWATLEKVSERIMEVWNARKDKSEKVLLLAAVNAGKQFCGLAEMTGPWNPNAKLDGWRDPASGAGSLG